MKQVHGNKNTQSPSLFGEMTKEKASGLAFSAATLAPTVFTVVFLLFVGAFGLLTEGYEQQDWYLYCNYLLPQISFFAVGVLYFCLTKEKVSSVASLPKWHYFVLAIILQIGLFSLGDLNTYFLQFLENFGYESKPVQLPSLEGGGVVGVLLVVALMPALFEELIFRGILLKGMKSFPVWAAALLCGGMFSIFHMNPAQTLYQFCCGVAFAFVAIRSGSIWPTALMHLCNNGLLIVLAALGVTVETLPLPLFIASLVCLVGTIIYLIFFDKSGNQAWGKTQEANAQEAKGKQGTANEQANETKKNRLWFFLCAGVGLLVCLLTWITVLMKGV